jgi:hypothetical protein
MTLIKVKAFVTGSILTGDKYKILQKSRVKSDPDAING